MNIDAHKDSLPTEIIPAPIQELTPKQQSFVLAYVVHRQAVKAVRESDYEVTPGNERQVAYALMQKKHIRTAIDELSQQVYSHNQATIEEMVQILANQARADIAEMFGDDGNLLPLKEMPKETRDAIESIDATTHYLGGELTGITHKLKIASKRAAAVELLRILGAYNRVPDENKKPPTVLSLNPLNGAKDNNSPTPDK